eukprot:SAG31_NODE_173_length_21354_cov_16.826112_3_plen_264_part_00
MQERDDKVLQHVVGSLPKSSVNMFERLVYRVGRGNVHTRFMDMDMRPQMGSEQKVVFVALLQGHEMKRKVAKIANNFKANVFEYNPATVDSDRKRVQEQLAQRSNTVNKTQAHISAELTNIIPKLPEWQKLVVRERQIYMTLNKFAPLAELRDDFDSHHSEFLTGEAWCPVASVSAVQHTLRAAQQVSRATAPSACRTFKSHSTPPTYFKVGKITTAFQSIVEAYGVARYREHSPVRMLVCSPHVVVVFVFGLRLHTDQQPQP